MLYSKIALTALLAAAGVVATLPARANCAMPITYEAVVDGNSVTVTPVSFGEGTCPQPGGMLRQDPTSGEIVQLADFCTTAPSGDKAYLDECVPKGTYRYGFAVPYACNSSSCNVDYFTEATVTNPLDAACERSPDDPGPTAAEAVPWKDDPTICSYQEGGGGSGGSTVTGGGGSGGETSGGTAGDNGSGKDSSGGCSMGSLSGAVPVFGANIAALLVGFALMRRRKDRRA